jgi:hypothetical protein
MKEFIFAAYNEARWKTILAYDITEAWKKLGKSPKKWFLVEVNPSW